MKKKAKRRIVWFVDRLPVRGMYLSRKDAREAKSKSPLATGGIIRAVLEHPCDQHYFKTKGHQ